MDYKGYLFDIGGHRFFTKWDEVNQVWREILGDKFLARPRRSRIFYRNRFFLYPLKGTNASSAWDPLKACESCSAISGHEWSLTS